MTRRSVPCFVICAVAVGLSGGRRVLADGEAASDKPAAADAALGHWVAAASAKLANDATLHAFAVHVEKDAAGYRASTRAELTLPRERSAILAQFSGHPSQDGILFESTARHRTVDLGEPVALDPASMRVTAKGEGLEVHLGNDKEGYTDLTLVRKPDGEDRLDPERMRGEWGGEMPHLKLSEKVILDELYLTMPSEGAWTADVRMECTVLVDDHKIPVTVIANYEKGHVDGSRVRFAIVPWHRTVPGTGQKDDLVGNPLVLEISDDGRLAGLFEGEDGWDFTLLRRAAAPTVDALGGAWGGDFHDARLNDELLIRVGKLDVARKPDGDWSAAVEFTFVVKTEGGDVLVGVHGSYPPGCVDGDAVKFPATKLTRTIVSTGAQNEMDGNPLEIRREPDGSLEAKFVGEGGFTLTMVKR